MNRETTIAGTTEAESDRVSGFVTAVLALAAGLAAFSLATVAVTEFAGPRIEFSLFVGLPAGVVAGLVAAVLVGGGLSRGRGRRYRLALAGGVAGGAFLLVGAGVAVLVGVTVGILAGVGTGIVGGAVVLWTTE